MKPLLLHFLIISAILFFGPVSHGYGQQSYTTQVKTVVIDPGHGGNDPGAVSGSVKEKDIVLKVALKLGDMIKKAHPDVNIIYTRKTDVLIPLYERGNIANKANADLFISIHVNAAASAAASGTETFVMGDKYAKNNLEVAMRENDVIVLEEDYETRYQGYKAGSPESFIIFSLMQYVYQEQSIMYADIIQKHFKKNTPYGDRGTKQGNLIVLWNSSMPSVLTELGFISNANDRKFMTSDAGQTKLAQSLCDAFTEYKNKVEKGSTATYEAGANSRERETVRESLPASVSGDIKFRIQVAASSRKMNMSSSSQFGTYRNKVTEMRVDGLYKYYVEETSSYREAAGLLQQAKQKFKDAFIVAFSNGERVAITDEMKRN
ncbi:MAG: N-acetylmuramoyl-L-alanine amidase [Rikenellaceae bacterium]|nr:N-acetylmuramoyl-L-alanine amidase [Rikenellaceae bacterium]